MVETTAYSMLAVAATLDGMAVSGYFDGDDAIEVTPGADAGSLLVGAAGDAIFSGSADRSATIVLRLQPTSPTHRQLTQKWLQQRAGRFLWFPFDVVDTSTGEGGTAARCLISVAPPMTKGIAATVREWTLVTGEWTPRVPAIQA